MALAYFIETHGLRFTLSLYFPMKLVTGLDFVIMDIMVCTILCSPHKMAKEQHGHRWIYYWPMPGVQILHLSPTKMVKIYGDMYLINGLGDAFEMHL